MYCQECGSNIRSKAKFCNQCGMKVRQRFGSSDAPAVSENTAGKKKKAPPPPPVPPTIPSPVSRASDQPPFAEHSWPGAEEAIVMPAVGRGASKTSSPAPDTSTKKNRMPDTDDPQEMRTRFDIPRPVTGAQIAPDTGEIHQAVTERKKRQTEYKPFFTQLGTAVPNRQHNRVVMVVPLLLIVSVLLFLFAYIASK